LDNLGIAVQAKYSRFVSLVVALFLTSRTQAKPVSDTDEQCRFAGHAEIVNPKGIREGRASLFGEGWSYVWRAKHNESHGRAARIVLQETVDFYSAEGRPRR